MAAILQGGDRDTINTSQFAITNYEEDYSFDADTATLSVTSNVLSTLIRDLIAKGIVNGTVA